MRLFVVQLGRLSNEGTTVRLLVQLQVGAHHKHQISHRARRCDPLQLFGKHTGPLRVHPRRAPFALCAGKRLRTTSGRAVQRARTSAEPARTRSRGPAAARRAARGRELRHAWSATRLQRVAGLAPHAVAPARQRRASAAAPAISHAARPSSRRRRQRTKRGCRQC